MNDPQETLLSTEELALEAQLRSMAPADLSNEAQTDIANRLDCAPAIYRHVRWAVAIAATVLIVIIPLVLERHGNEQPTPRSIQASNASTLPAVLANDEKQFAIAAYSNALAHSPASLDALLVQQSRQTRNDEVNKPRIPRSGDVSIATP